MVVRDQNTNDKAMSFITMFAVSMVIAAVIIGILFTVVFNVGGGASESSVEIVESGENVLVQVDAVAQDTYLEVRSDSDSVDVSYSGNNNRIEEAVSGGAMVKGLEDGESFRVVEVSSDGSEEVIQSYTK